ncbi:hypothetical protein EON64_01780 [archaeon]|nr:MAG: hypothetical protein EON64_01780 [archaeon]
MVFAVVFGSGMLLSCVYIFIRQHPDLFKNKPIILWKQKSAAKIHHTMVVSNYPFLIEPDDSNPDNPPLLLENVFPELMDVETPRDEPSPRMARRASYKVSPAVPSPPSDHNRMPQFTYQFTMGEGEGEIAVL